MDETFGHSAETTVINRLKYQGIDTRRARVKAPFDILADGKPVEVKAARYSDGQWVFNIHRHGAMPNFPIHAYVLCLADFPSYDQLITLVVPPKIKGYTVNINPRTLLRKWAKYADRWDVIQRPYKWDVDVSPYLQARYSKAEQEQLVSTAMSDEWGRDSRTNAARHPLDAKLFSTRAYSTYVMTR